MPEMLSVGETCAAEKNRRCCIRGCGKYVVLVCQAEGNILQTQAIWEDRRLVKTKKYPHLLRSDVPGRISCKRDPAAYIFVDSLLH